MKSRIHLVRVTVSAEIDVAIEIPEDEDLPEEAQRRAGRLMLAEAFSDEIHEAMGISYEDVTEGLTVNINGCTVLILRGCLSSGK